MKSGQKENTEFVFAPPHCRKSEIVLQKIKELGGVPAGSLSGTDKKITKQLIELSRGETMI